MPFDPGIQYRGDQYSWQGITGAGNELVKLIEKNKQDQATGTQADTIVANAVKNGDMTPEEHEAYLKAPLEKKKGIVGGLAINFVQNQQRQAAAQKQALEQANIRYFDAHAKAQEALASSRTSGGYPNAGETYYHPTTGEPIGVWTSNGTIQQFNTKGANADEDSWVKLNKDVKNQSGFGLGDWQRAGKKAIDPQTGEFTAELPSSNGVTINGVTYGGSQPKTMRMPGPTYQDFLSRFQDLSRTTPNAMPGAIPALPQTQSPAGPQAAPSPTPSPAAAAAPALSAQDQQALQWAKTNPTDPRSAAILQKLGVQQ